MPALVKSLEFIGVFLYPDPKRQAIIAGKKRGLISIESIMVPNCHGSRYWIFSIIIKEIPSYNFRGCQGSSLF